MYIRDALDKDLPGLLEIYNEAILHTTATFDLVEHTLEERKTWFEKYGGKYPLLVADVDGEAAGYCSLSSFRDKEAYSKTVEISIYVSSKHRGKGIAKKLMEEILSQAKNIGYHVIMAGITAGNDSSVELHKKFGFQYAGCFKEVGYKFGQWQDVLFYQLILE
ncbi:GNAT family N-acetyltransferase [Peribacillus deserti]|uniref:GNAT family N-acetyltransferase n=1 Tax=Peribacillus deserti TaxID=673318 RepID=A0A2N5M0Y4_9BACI|nr:GNAT family N-acetyltransferase [Peribacillus deserti]PLT28010.1 GNAT family N-acetyltransferase [Peribacillus deserti]